jgi:hypothetical protein
MKTLEIKGKFVEGTVTAEEAKRQRVARLIHARLSHGVEREETFLLMRDGTLTRIKPKEAEPPEVRAERSAVPVFEAIDRIHAAAAGARVSETMLTADEPLRQALGGRDGVREVLHALLQMGYLETTGSTKDKDIVVTAAGRALASRANARAVSPPPSNSRGARIRANPRECANRHTLCGDHVLRRPNRYGDPHDRPT